MFPFQASLNASTLFPFKLDLAQQIRVAADAGYQGLEIWMRDVDAWQAAGKRLAELRAEAEARGLVLANAIAFFAWADSDPTARAAAFEQAEREMHMLAELGCRAVAAPPFGNVETTSLSDMAAAFARLTQLGQHTGVEPYLEFWGRAKTLSRLSQAIFVALESGLPDVKLLLDPFHMYTGGSSVAGLSYLKGRNIGIVHVNDYPADPPQATISDAERVMPGAGIAPNATIAQALYDAGYRGFLSLELFQADCGGATALDVAQRGLAAIHAAYQVDGGQVS